MTLLDTADNRNPVGHKGSRAAAALYQRLEDARRYMLRKEGREPLCTIDPDMFFPDYESNAAAAMTLAKEAKRYCQPCPLRELCRDYAVAAEEEFGIWGGTSARERRAIRRGRTDDLEAA